MLSFDFRCFSEQHAEADEIQHFENWGDILRRLLLSAVAVSAVMAGTTAAHADAAAAQNGSMRSPNPQF